MEKLQPELRFPEFKGDWKNTRVGAYTYSSAFGPRFSSDLYSPLGNVVTLRTTDMTLDGKISYEKSPRAEVDIEQFKEHLLLKDDLVISRSGTIGITGIFEGFEMPVLPAAFLIRFRLNKNELYPKFIQLLFNSDRGRSKIESLAAGGVQKNLTGTSVLNMHIDTPTLPEQTKIAEFLTAIDKRIELLTAKKKKLTLYKKDVMQKIFNQEIRFKIPDGHGELVEPPEWEEKTFLQLFRFITTNSLSRDKLNYVQGDIYNVHYGDIHVKFKSHFYVQSENVPFVNADVDAGKFKLDSFCVAGDLLIADASENYDDIGKSIEVVDVSGKKVVAGLHTIQARPVTVGLLSIGFAGFLMQSQPMKDQIRKIAQGTKVLGISMGRLADLNIGLPELEEQNKIVSFLSSIDTEIQKVENQIALNQKYKKGLLQKMFV